MDVTTRRMVFDTFYNSGLHGGLWSKIVYAIVKVQYFDKCLYVYAQNTASSHAEIQALSYLEKLLQSDLVNCPTIGLTFYVSLSPCQDCSTRIVSFLMKSRMMYGAKLDMKIIFPSLYKIIRPSCIEFGHHNGHHKIPSPEEHDKNLRGLIHLTQNGIILETFGDWQWADLARILTVNSLSFIQGQKRLFEDGVLKEDFERLFSPRVGAQFLLPPFCASFNRPLRPQTPSLTDCWNNRALPPICDPLVQLIQLVQLVMLYRLNAQLVNLACQR